MDAALIQICAPQPFGMPGTHDQPSQVLTILQPGILFPGGISRLSQDVGRASNRGRSDHPAAHNIVQSWGLLPSLNLSADARPNGL